MYKAGLAQNAITNSMKVPKDSTNVAAIASSDDADAGCTIELRVRMFPGQTPFAISVWDAISHSEVSHLTGASQYGWADVPGAEEVYVVRTDAGTAGGVGLALVTGSGH